MTAKQSVAKTPRNKASTGIKLLDIVDVAIGGQERGELNVNVLRVFFKFIIDKLEIAKEIAFIDPEMTETLKESETEVVETPVQRHGPPKFKILNEGTPDERKEYLDERVFGLCGIKTDIEFSCLSIGSVFKALRKLEDSTKALDDFEDQYNLQRLINPHEKIYPTILCETWRGLKIVRQVFKNQTDLAEINISFEVYRNKMAELKAFNDEIRKAVTELTKGQVDETGRPIFTNPFEAMAESLGKVSVVIERFPDFEAEFRRVQQKLGQGTLPSLAFLDNMSSWCSMEALTQNNPICYVPIETRKEAGDAAPTKTFIALCLKLSQMIKYNEEKMRRLRAIEVHLEHLKLKNATKKEAQKLIERMAEVDGIGTAVERLLCRTQKCEDMICSMRQVVNKVYGCLTSNPSTRYESENLWACMFNQDEGSRGEMAEGDLVSDAQMKNFHAQITKIDCEAKIIVRSMMNVDAVKVDVKNLFAIANELEENKLDKCVLSTEISKKADRHSVDDKVTRFCFQQTCEGINAIISEILSRILENDKECHKVINYLTGKTRLKAANESLYSFRGQAENKLRCLAQRLTNMYNYRRNQSLNNNSNNAATTAATAAATTTTATTSGRRSVALSSPTATKSKSKSANCNNSNNNNRCSCDSCSSSSRSDISDASYDDVGFRERPEVEAFLSRLENRSRCLADIDRSFRRINSSFRVMTEAMYDFESYGEFFQSLREKNFGSSGNGVSFDCDDDIKRINDIDVGDCRDGYDDDSGDRKLLPPLSSSASDFDKTESSDEDGSGLVEEMETGWDS